MGPVLAKLEAIWWMLRPSAFVLSVSLAAAGWLWAPRSDDNWALLSLLVAVALVRGIANLLNDLLDSSGDAETSPFLPIPAGLVSRLEACAAVLVLGGLAAIAGFIAAGSLERFALSVAIGFSGSAMIVLYSLLKARGVLALVPASLTYALLPLYGWAMGGGGGLGRALLLILGLGLCAGVAANLTAALWDVDTDPAVGNLTVAVRHGPVRTFAVTAAAALLAWLAVAVGLAVGPSHVWLGAAALAAALALLLFGYRHARPSMEETLSRAQRIVAMEPFALGRLSTCFAACCAFGGLVGLAISVAMIVLLESCNYGYRRRLIEGGLVKSQPSGASLAGRVSGA